MRLLRILQRFRPALIGTERGRYLARVIRKTHTPVFRVAEIGVWQGHTAKTLLDLLPGISRYHLIDPWLNYPAYESTGDPKANDTLGDAVDVCRQRLAPYAYKLVWHPVTSGVASCDIEDASLDLVFIDANHACAYTKQDIALWLPKVRPGGILAGHDIDHPQYPGVRVAVEECFGVDFTTGPDRVWWVVRGGRTP